jgi:carbon monoxide dehydrogenase subunit G
MPSIEKSLRINAPVAAVWKTLADFAAISAWAPNVQHSSWTTEQHDGVGTVRRVQVGRFALLERVTEWAEEQVLGYQLIGLPAPAGTVSNTWRLRADGAGTAVTLTASIHPAVPGPPGKLVGKVLGRQLGKANGEMLAGLASYVTSGANS